MIASQQMYYECTKITADAMKSQEETVQIGDKIW